MWTQQFGLHKPSAPKTAEEQRAQELVTASVFIEDNRARILKAMDEYHAVADSKYWHYGYMGGTMLATMGICLSLGTRVSVLQRYARWIALAGGYFGGQAIHGVHNAYNLRSVVSVIDRTIAETNKMDEQHGSRIHDYAREVAALRRRRNELMPHSIEAIEAQQNDLQQMSLDERVDALVAAYEKRKQAMAQKK
ncbi:hypothetical protein ERJ75_000193800 [Trypanosoma vivax]|uniref:Uncharacterized protein n=1 Tax=Trypanosoma vivax (strain Y486) TaxID=1055687 RepID=G0UA38_TRYVY|nr:hypothetical protein TRVL_03125 [Trypanosoma vivax]KAH8619093.1 hypothetical protein ERJ75_000193800 [Trypanosoma vivax]CCC52670.1 conserved hypothetical protein [Trypanosoma vivax Y486]